jgi:transcriptional regulator with XRE-family HTH domain
VERIEPSALRWLVGVELAAYRTQAGATKAEAAQVLGVSGGMITHFENGKYRPSPEQIARLLDFFGAPAYDVDRLSWLVGRSERKSWLARWDDVIPDWARTYVGLEGLASDLIAYCPLLLNALVQTREYSAGVTMPSARVREDQQERMVNLRMDRQKRVLDPDRPLRITTLIEEAVLDRLIGGPRAKEVMRAQFGHLLELGKRDNVEILIVPTSVGRHDGLEGKFTVLHFRNEDGSTQAQSIAFVEISDDAVYVQDQRQVDNYLRSVAQIRDVALTQAQSARVIRERRAALD